MVQSRSRQLKKTRPRKPRKHRLALCEKCPLEKAAHVREKLNPSKLLLIGEAPATQEIKDQRFFAERKSGGGNLNAGYVLWESARQLGIEREEVMTTNLLLCQTPGNRDPTAAEIACCAPRLRDTIKKTDPELILALGKVAAKVLIGKNVNVGDSRNRDWSLSIGDKEYLLWVTYHPAGTLYNQSLFPDFVNDLERSIKHVHGETVDKAKAKFVVLKSVKQLKELNGILGDTIVVDLETTSLERFHPDCKILCAGIMTVGSSMIYIIPDDILYADLETFNTLFVDRDQIYQNGSFDVAVLVTNGVPAAKVKKDTMLIHFCTDERRGTHGLKGMAQEMLGADDYEEAIRKWLPTKKSSYSMIPRPVLYKYLGLDVYYTEGLVEPLEKLAREEDTLRVHDNIMIPALEPLMEMSRHGIMVDLDYTHDLGDELENERDEIRKEIEDRYGDINPNSPAQVKTALVDLDLVPPDFAADENSSTKEEVLLNILAASPECDFPQLVLDHRKIGKNLSTYVTGTLKHVLPDGRVHADFLLHGTVTGRLASRRPNMQNIPRDIKMRDMFCAPPGKKLVNIDYSQFEFRMIGHYAKDPDMLAMYQAGGSIHKEIAIAVYGPDYNEEDYAHAKMVVFGVSYGREAYSLSLQMKISVREAQDWIDGFFERMPRVRPYQQALIKETLARGWVVTELGRRRRFPLVTPGNVTPVIKETLNFQPQSTCSDILLMDMAELYHVRRLQEFAPIVNEMHDSLLFEVDEGDIPKLIDIAVPVMEEMPSRVLDTEMPFKVEVKVGDRWGTVEDYKI